VNTVLLRADGSERIGTGHLRRCLVLASALRQAGLKPVLVTRAQDGVAPDVLAGQSLDVVWLPAQAAPDRAEARLDPSTQRQDALAFLEAAAPWAAAGQVAGVVVDHYGLDAHWHGAIRDMLSSRIAVIDDLANRPLDADVLIDANWHPAPKERYAPHLNRDATTLLGPAYALLADRFRLSPPSPIETTVRSIGIFVGGTDPADVSAALARSCRGAGFASDIEVVSTTANARLDALRSALAPDRRTRLTVNASDLAGFFGRHGLHIGAGGTSTWERCCLGAPTVALTVAPNQVDVVAALDTVGVVLWANRDEPLASRDALAASTTRALMELLPNAHRRRQMSLSGRRLVDGWGAHRVAAFIVGPAFELRARPATRDDEGLLLDWANDAATRAQSYRTQAIDAAEHHRWLRAILSTPDSHRLFIAQGVGGLPVGQARYDRTPSGAWRLNYALAPQMRGCGLGRPLVACTANALSVAVGPCTLSAQVKADNRASQRVLQGLGFEPVDDPDTPAGSMSWRADWPPVMAPKA